MLLTRLNANILEAGLDEAGRGCLAGPVFAAAVILPPDFQHPLLNDSKKMSAAHRDKLRVVIEEQALAWSVAAIPPETIDEINILWASVKAMHLAVERLPLPPEMLLVDGNRFKPYPDIPHKCIVGGDGKVASIAAASVLAKTHRDAFMNELADLYPNYGWNRNKGYPTLEHREAIARYGRTPCHRSSFRLLAGLAERNLFEK